MNELILLVEDEESLAVGLEFNLTEEGYKIVWAKAGQQAVDIFSGKNFDLIILDIMLPYLSGFEVAEIIRQKSPQMPILMLTARTGVNDRVKGLEAGADDYLTKPFHLKELLLRVKGMLKRKSWYSNLASANPVYELGKVKINFENLECSCREEKFRLTQKEAMVLKYLIENEGKIVTRKELIEKVWHMNPEIETRTVDNFIVRLRKYFEKDPSAPEYFQSIRGEGYLFKSSR